MPSALTSVALDVNAAYSGGWGEVEGGEELRYARRASPDALLLLAPFHDGAQRIPDVPTTVLLGTCDVDTELTGAGYVDAAAKRARKTPVVQVTLARANHDYYNQTLAAAKLDDAAGKTGACADGRRPPPQQACLARVAVDHFATALLGKPAPAWARASGSRTLYGRSVTVQRVD